LVGCRPPRTCPPTMTPALAGLPALRTDRDGPYTGRLVQGV